MGMKQPVFGAAACWATTCCASPARTPRAWKSFTRTIRTATTRPGWTSRSASRAAYHAKVGHVLFAGLRHHEHPARSPSATAGLNRGKIRDALYSVESYKGVTGEMVFDPNAKNIAPLYLGKVKDGKFTLPPLHHGEALRRGGRRRRGVRRPGLAGARAPN